MKHRIISLSAERPRSVFALTALVAVVATVALFRIQVDTDPENMLPADQPDRVFHDEVEETFALHDAIVVGLVNETNPNGIYNPDSLGRLHALSARILGIEGVISPDLMSLAASDNITQTETGVALRQASSSSRPSTRIESFGTRI